MAKRRDHKEVGKKDRFEVFKRDSFKCQYCGKSAPDVVLHLDHIKPVTEGGANDLLNLITSCIDCNLGKGPRLLDDKSIIEKQRQQLAELQERRDQLEMMLQWREGLAGIDDEKLKTCVEFFDKRVEGELNEYAHHEIRKWIKQYGLPAVLSAMETAADTYLEVGNSGYTAESKEKAFEYTLRILRTRAADIEKPYLKDLLYIRGILRKRVDYVDQPQALRLLEAAYLAGASIEALKAFTFQVYTWRKFEFGLERFIAEAEHGTPKGPRAY